MATIAWSRDFDNSPRHCFEGNDGHRWLNGDIDTECRKAHTPRLIGLTEWLRFIREFGAQVSEDQNPFTSEGGFRLFDYGQGEGTHKQTFSTDSVRCADLYYFRRSLRVGFLVALHGGLDGLSRKVGAILQRLGLKSRIKKLFRRN